MLDEKSELEELAINELGKRGVLIRQEIEAKRQRVRVIKECNKIE